MGSGHEQFILVEDEELKRIRKKKIAGMKEKERELATKPVHVTDSNFDEIVNKHPLALIDMWASWCGPCLALAPVIEELTQKYAGKILVGKLDVDENPKTAERFGIFSIPTMVIMKDGKEVDRIVGLVPKNNIERILKKYLG